MQYLTYNGGSEKVHEVERLIISSEIILITK
jgi:hypothetical protein